MTTITRRMSYSAMKRKRDARNAVLVCIGALVFGLPLTLLFATCLGESLANDYTVLPAIARLAGL